MLQTRQAGDATVSLHLRARCSDCVEAADWDQSSPVFVSPLEPESGVYLLQGGRSVQRIQCRSILWLLAAASVNCAGDDRFQAKVVRVADGDTITVLRGREPIKIRLHGIDAPENGQPFGNRAKQFVVDLAVGKVVTVRPRDIDRYGRMVADVILPDGQSLGHDIVGAGFAWGFRYAANDNPLAAIERDARLARRGLWADAKPTPPWEWRHTRGGETQAMVEGPRAPRLQPAASAPIIGNRWSRIYHEPSCPGYHDIAPKNRVPFASREAAERAGYRLARNCP